MVNHTKRCHGCALIIFQSPPASEHDSWAQIPPEWMSTGEQGEAVIRFVSKSGTLCPSSLGLPSRPRFVPISGLPANAGSSNGVLLTKRTREDGTDEATEGDCSDGGAGGSASGGGSSSGSSFRSSASAHATASLGTNSGAPVNASSSVATTATAHTTNHQTMATATTVTSAEPPSAHSLWHALAHLQRLVRARVEYDQMVRGEFPPLVPEATAQQAAWPASGAGVHNAGFGGLLTAINTVTAPLIPLVAAGPSAHPHVVVPLAAGPPPGTHVPPPPSPLAPTAPSPLSPTAELQQGVLVGGAGVQQPSSVGGSPRAPSILQAAMHLPPPPHGMAIEQGVVSEDQLAVSTAGHHALAVSTAGHHAPCTTAITTAATVGRLAHESPAVAAVPPVAEAHLEACEIDAWLATLHSQPPSPPTSPPWAKLPLTFAGRRQPSSQAAWLAEELISFLTLPFSPTRAKWLTVDIIAFLTLWWREGAPAHLPIVSAPSAPLAAAPETKSAAAAPGAPRDWRATRLLPSDAMELYKNPLLAALPLGALSGCIVFYLMEQVSDLPVISQRLPRPTPSHALSQTFLHLLAPPLSVSHSTWW